jgi:hypothetical protein
MLDRPQRRLLRRLYNGREKPIIADGHSFLTYKEATKYLEGLAIEMRDAVIADMKAYAKGENRIEP